MLLKGSHTKHQSQKCLNFLTTKSSGYKEFNVVFQSWKSKLNEIRTHTTRSNILTFVLCYNFLCFAYFKKSGVVLQPKRNKASKKLRTGKEQSKFKCAYIRKRKKAKERNKNVVEKRLWSKATSKFDKQANALSQWREHIGW